MQHLFSQTAGSFTRPALFSRPSARIPSVTSYLTTPTRQTLKSLAGMLLLLTVLFLGYSPTAQATHVRYSSVTWAPTTGRTVQFKFSASFRTSFSGYPAGSIVVGQTVAEDKSFFFGDGTAAANQITPVFTITSINTQEDYFFAEATFTHTYAANGNYKAYYADCCRLSTLQNNHDSPYGVTTLVNVGPGNSSPVSSLVPIVNLAIGLPNASFLVPASSPNGKPLSFSLAAPSDLTVTAANFTQPTGLSISAAGQVTFNTVGKTVDQLYNAAVRISDGTTYIVVDFIIKMVANTGTAPTFVYGGITPVNGSTIQGVVGAPISFTVRANDTDVGSTVTLNGSSLPPGSSFSSVTGTGTASSIFSFTPTAAGSSVLTFSAIDDIGKQTLTAVTLQICSPIIPTLTASNKGILTCLNPSLMLTAGGGSFYVLLGPGINQSGSTNKVTVTQAGTYTVIVSGGTSCPTSATTTVVSNTVSPQNITLTPGPSATLTCAQTSVQLTAASSTTGVSYVFSGAGITAQSSNTATVNRPDTYTVVGTGTNGCTASTTTAVSSNTAPPSASITPATVTICAGQSATLTASGGGSYVWSNSQVSASISATATGPYSVTVTGTNGCSNTATASVTVNPLPTPSIVNLPGSFCQDATPLSLNGSPTGGVFTVDGVTATMLTPTSLSVGQHTVSYSFTNASQCSATTSQTVTINALPVLSITGLSAAYCQDATPVTLTATPAGGTFTVDGTTATTLTPASLSVGQHTVGYSSTNASQCSATTSQTLTINALPTPAITGLSAAYCKDATPVTLAATPAGGTFTVDGTAATTLTPTSLSVGQHTVVYSFTNASQCSATTSQTLTINALPVLSITGLSAAYCKDAIPVTLAATPAGGTFTVDGTTATTLTPASLSVGQHTVGYSSTNASQCSATTSQTLTINALPVLSITGLSAAYCKDATPVTLAATPAGGTFTVDGTAATTLTPASLTVGQHTVVYSFTNASQCSATTSQTLTINALPTPAITGLSAAYCKDAIPVTLAATPAGGTFTVDGTAATTLTPASLTVGQHTVVYSFTNASQCSATTSQTLTINALPTPAITGLSAAYCKDATPVTLAATPAGGTFTVDGVTATMLTPTSLSVGQHTVVYSFTNASQCSATTSQTVTINALPVLSITGLSAAYCKDATPVTLAATPAGGTFTVDGVTATMLTPTSLSVGQHTVVYSFTNASQCSATTSQTVTINALPVLSITGLSAAYCKDATPVTLAATPAGGTFTVDGVTATMLTPTSLSVGQHTVVYSFTNASQCSATTSQTVTINALPVLSITGLSAAYCKDATPVTLAATPAGGTFTVDGTAATTLTPASLTVGQHTVVYSFTNASQCSATTSQTLTINALPVLSITGLSAAYCKDATPVTLAATPAGGTFTVDGTAATTLTPASLTVGQHTVVYSFTNASQCSATTSQTLTINALPTPAITGLSAAYCKDATPVTLAATPAGGTFTVDGVTATTLTPASLSVGQHTVVYSFTNASQCSATASQTLTINALPSVLILPSAPTVINSQAISLTATGADSYRWSTTETTPVISVTPTSATTYSVTGTTAGCNGTASIGVTVNSTPVAVANDNQNAILGVNFAYTVRAFTDIDTPNSLTYSATISPTNGLTFDPATRLISGLPTLGGAATVTITATDPGGLSATTTFTITVETARLTLLSRDPDNGQLNTNTLKPYLLLENDGDTPIPYGQLTIRYWLTVENPAPLRFEINYAQMGNDRVHFTYVPVSPARQGATGYVEISFDASAGSLAPGSNAVIQSFINKQDYSYFNQGDDYSYLLNRDYAPNARITAYRNGVLIYGQEPGAVEPPTALTLLVSANQTTIPTTGSTQLQATVSGGTAPYSYAFAGPGTIQPSGNTASVSGLSAGVQTFTVTVTDANTPVNQALTATLSVTVTTPVNQTPITTPNDNQTATVGTLFVYTAGAFTDDTPASLTYTARIDPANGFTFDPVTRRIQGIPQNTGLSSVTLTATDPGGLSASTVFTITVLPQPVVTPLSLTLSASPTAILTTNTTQLQATVSGGTASYSYAFSGPGTIQPSGSTASVSGLSAGVQTFTVTVTDANTPVNQTLTATVSVSVTTPVVLPTSLRVASRDPDNGQLNTNTLKPYLLLENDGDTPIPYGQLTIRYWLTVENPAPLRFEINYAQMGNDRVHFTYVPVSPARQGATGYVEISFDASAGSLAPGSNAVIQSFINKQDYSYFNQGDDYSYLLNRDYAPNARITAYVSGSLVWGQEPPVAVRLSAEPVTEWLRVEVLGNPAGSSLRVGVSGAGGQSLHYELTDISGHQVSERQVERAGAEEQQVLSLEQAPAGMLFLRVSSPTQSQTVKVLKR